MRTAIKNQPPTSLSTAIAWTIAGSDSGGGAGIQVDLKVMNAFGVHGCSVITALTAQNTLGVEAADPVSEVMMRAQLEVLATDLPPVAIKTGMLGSRTNVQILADFLASQSVTPPPLICDPVLKSTSGTDLLDPEAIDILKNNLFPHVTVLTPNLPETESLLGKIVNSAEDAAEQLLTMGVHSVLIKGGHTDENVCRDYWTDGKQSISMVSPRIETTATHGTGCILSAAITSGLALGKELPEAVIDAKTFLNQCLHQPAHIGCGQGPVRIEPFVNAPQDRPAL